MQQPQNCLKRKIDKTSLVGGFNPSEKYQSNWIISLSRGENKEYLKSPVSIFYPPKKSRTSFFSIYAHAVLQNTALPLPNTTVKKHGGVEFPRVIFTANFVFVLGSFNGNRHWVTRIDRMCIKHQYMRIEPGESSRLDLKGEWTKHKQPIGIHGTGIYTCLYIWLMFIW